MLFRCNKFEFFFFENVTVFTEESNTGQNQTNRSGKKMIKLMNAKVISNDNKWSLKCNNGRPL